MSAENRELRLVGGRSSRGGSAMARQERVAAENRQAAIEPSLDPSDPRWVLAVRTRSVLQGGLLTLDQRERLLRLGTRLGLRRFDSNVIISLMQDEARVHRPASDSTSLLAIVPDRRGQRSSTTAWLWTWTAAIATAAIGALLLARWLLVGG